MARPGLGRRGSSLNLLSFLPSGLKSKTLALLLEAPGSKSKFSQDHDDFPKVLSGSTRGAITLVSQPHVWSSSSSIHVNGQVPWGGGVPWGLTFCLGFLLFCILLCFYFSFFGTVKDFEGLCLPLSAQGFISPSP